MRRPNPTARSILQRLSPPIPEMIAVTDTQNRKFYSAQRMNRGSMGIAGVQAIPFKAWIDDWQAVQVKADTDTLHLTARNGRSPWARLV